MFCEKGVFGLEETRRILQAGKAAGLAINFHGDELHPMKAAEVKVKELHLHCCLVFLINSFFFFFFFFTKGNALNGEKEFPLLLKFPFAIRRGSNIFFYLDFILH